MNNIRYFELLQKYTELLRAFDDTLEMNRKFGTENVRLEKENEQLKQLIEKLKKCGNCKHSRYLCQSSYALICKFTDYFCEKTCDKWELAE